MNKNVNSLRITPTYSLNATPTHRFNPLIATLKLQATDHHRTIVIGTPAVDWCAVTFGTVRREGARPVPSLLYQM